MIIKLMRGAFQFQNGVPDEINAIFDQLKNGQHPGIFMIACADSRLMPTLITQGKPGDVFMHRNVGNMMPAYNPEYDESHKFQDLPSEIATLEYALVGLEVTDIIICGHSDCGAMKTRLNPNSKLKWTNHWVYAQACSADTVNEQAPISPLEQITKQNILAQLEKLRTYPIVQEKIQEGKLTLHGWYFDFELKKVFVYEPSCDDFVDLHSALNFSIERRKEKIINMVTINYLKELPQPQDPAAYLSRRKLFKHLAMDLRPIWNEMQPIISKALWTELEGLYSSTEDLQFQTLVDQAMKSKLSSFNTKDLLKGLEKSKGFYEYCHSHLSNKSKKSSNATKFTPLHCAKFFKHKAYKKNDPLQDIKGFKRSH